MHIIVKAFFLALLALAPGFGFSQTISEASVRKAIAQYDEAYARKDLAAIGRLLSDKVSLEITVEIAGKVGKEKLDKATYLDSLRQGFAAGGEGTYKRENMSIKMLGQNRAVMTSDTSETFKIQGRALRSTGFAITWFELVGGKVLVTSAEATGRLSQ